MDSKRGEFRVAHVVRVVRKCGFGPPDPSVFAWFWLTPYARVKIAQVYPQARHLPIGVRGGGRFSGGEFSSEILPRRFSRGDSPEEILRGDSIEQD